ncbi:MAG: peptide deformylase [Brevinematales bacterium]|jgi:peptide deformylase
MAKKEIVTYGNPVLRQRAEEVRAVDKDIMRIVHDMIETLEDGGVGLAATQIGIPKKIMLIDLSKSGEEKKITLFNPAIVYRSFEETEFEEGCLSVPDVWGIVSRPKSIKLKGTLPGGSTILIDADDYFARVLQHEMDHLDGRLFIDFLDQDDRDKNKERIEEILDANRKKLGKICL